MRDKADDTLAPPSTVNIPIPPPSETSKFILRKKPHTLPPLEKFRCLEGRGSPIPQARRRSSIEEQLLEQDGQVTPADGRPLIRLTKCGDDAVGGPAVGVGGGGGGGGSGTLNQRLPPSKQGAAAPSPSQQLSPITNRYTPLQPIRRAGESSAGNNNTP